MTLHWRMSLQLILIEAFIWPAHNSLIHTVLHLQHSWRYICQLFHSSTEKSISQKRILVALNSRRQLFVVSSKDHSSSLENRDPASDLQTLPAFVNHNQIKYSFREVLPENSVIGSHVSAANDINIVQNLLDGLLLKMKNLVPQLLNLRVNCSLFLTSCLTQTFTSILQFFYLTFPRHWFLGNEIIETMFDDALDHPCRVTHPHAVHSFI